MTLDTLRLLRNILLRSVVVAVIFALLLAAVTFGAWDWWTGLAVTILHTDETTLGRFVIGFFVEVRFYVLFVLLTPALAIHWTIQRERSRQA